MEYGIILTNSNTDSSMITDLLHTFHQKISRFENDTMAKSRNIEVGLNLILCHRISPPPAKYSEVTNPKIIDWNVIRYSSLE